MLQRKLDEPSLKANSSEELFIDSLLTLDFDTLDHLIISGRLESVIPGIKAVREIDREYCSDEVPIWELTKKFLSLTPKVESIRIAALIHQMRPFDSNIHIALENDKNFASLNYFKYSVAPNLTLSVGILSETEFLLRHVDLVSESEKLPHEIARSIATSKYIYSLITFQEAYAKSSAGLKVKDQRQYLEKIEFEYRPEENW